MHSLIRPRHEYEREQDLEPLRAPFDIALDRIGDDAELRLHDFRELQTLTQRDARHEDGDRDILAAPHRRLTAAALRATKARERLAVFRLILSKQNHTT